MNAAIVRNVETRLLLSTVNNCCCQSSNFFWKDLSATDFGLGLLMLLFPNWSRRSIPCRHCFLRTSPICQVMWTPFAPCSAHLCRCIRWQVKTCFRFDMMEVCWRLGRFWCLWLWGYARFRRSNIQYVWLNEKSARYTILPPLAFGLNQPNPNLLKRSMDKLCL